MEFIPTIEEAAAYAADGNCSCLPVCTQILSDIRTPVEVLRILKSVSGHCYLLESVSDPEHWGRWTFLGYDPKLEITCKDGKMKIGDLRLETDDPGKHIAQILEEYRSPQIPGLPPFTGGLVGYFSYDYLKYAEPVLRLDAQDLILDIGVRGFLFDFAA